MLYPLEGWGVYYAVWCKTDWEEEGQLRISFDSLKKSRKPLHLSNQPTLTFSPVLYHCPV